MSDEGRYVVCYPTYPKPTPLRDGDTLEVLRFPTREEAARAGEEADLPYPADNVWTYKEWQKVT